MLAGLTDAVIAEQIDYEPFGPLSRRDAPLANHPSFYPQISPKSQNLKRSWPKFGR